MLTIREKRRMVGAAKLALIVIAAVVVFTPKDVDLSAMMSFSVIGQAMASE